MNSTSGGNGTTTVKNVDIDLESAVTCHNNSSPDGIVGDDEGHIEQQVHNDYLNEIDVAFVEEHRASEHDDELQHAQSHTVQDQATSVSPIPSTQVSNKRHYHGKHIAWKSVSYQVKQKQILKDCWGEVSNKDTFVS